MKVAIFKSMEYGGEHVADELFENVKGYVRISEYVDVDFPTLEDEAIVGAQIEALDEVAEQATEKYRRTMAGIEERKSKLLAIPVLP